MREEKNNSTTNKGRGKQRPNYFLVALNNLIIIELNKK